MRERPIIFSGPMVRAILAGKKTQTRRAVKKPVVLDWLNQFLPEFVADKANGLSPYGHAGDRLWVRETYTMAERLMSLVKTPCYMADEGITENNRMPGGGWPWRWTPAIHMRREHSRLSLDVVGVRIEHLNTITREDAAAEGMCYCADENPRPSFINGSSWPEENFARLWDEINGRGAWAGNPWVWVVTFRRVNG